MPLQPPRFRNVIFDLGGVVVAWDFERIFLHAMPADEVPAFLAKIDFTAWNHDNDLGRPLDEGERQLLERFPDDAEAIAAYRTWFPDSLVGLVEGTGAVIAELQQAGLRLIGLTNWSAETFPHAEQKFKLLGRFEGIVVSGRERLAKPDPAIFQVALDRYDLDPAETVFVDDTPVNVAGAAALGLTALHFTDADRLRTQLVSLGLLGERAVPEEPIFHLADREAWSLAQLSGHYPWSSRNLTYQQQGFVHCSFAGQVDGVVSRIYPDVPREQLVLVELDPQVLTVPIVVEELGAGEAYPHLYAPLPLESVRDARPL